MSHRTHLPMNISSRFTFVAIAVSLSACGGSQPTAATTANPAGTTEGTTAGTAPTGTAATATAGPTAAAPRESGGMVAPDFTGRDVAGKTFRLSDYRGKVVLLDFWSTYCEPCKAEFPHLRAMYDGDRAKGLLVVGVSMDGPETVADVPSFVKRFELDFPVVTDEDSRIASLYNPKKSMPLSVLIDKAGRIVTVREGYSPGDEKLVAADVDKALAAAGP